MTVKNTVFPEAELCKNCFIVQEMSLPPEIFDTKKSLLRWFSLSLGLIGKQESRQTFLDVLDAVLYFNFSKKVSPTTLNIQSFIKKKSGTKVIEKLLRYHLNRLIQLGLIERKKSKYIFAVSPYADKNDFKASFDFLVSKKINEKLIDVSKVYEKLIDSYR